MRNCFCIVIFLLLTHLSAHAQEAGIRQLADTGRHLSSAIPLTYKARGKALSGIAGIYSNKLEGAITASGDIFSQNNLTAASNSFPLNTLVLITNPRNKKTVIVQINDRISAAARKKGALVELSARSAKALAFNTKFEYKINIQQIVITNLLSILNNEIDTITETNDSMLKNDTVSALTYKKTGTVIKGIASFYSTNLDGTKTSTGEIFRHKKLTGASNNLPLNTWVLVTNLKNKKTVIVRINDRMHPRMKKKGRVIDLSKMAADILDFVNDGLTRVSLEIIQVNGSLKPGDIVKVKDSIPGEKADSSALTGVEIPSNLQDSIQAGAEMADTSKLTGIASLYSENLDGSKTATGAIFKNSKLIAGSNSLKLNTLVKIVNLQNSKSMVLRINDHMRKLASKKGRIIELSRAVGKRLDFPKSGLAKVKIEVVAGSGLE